SVACFAACKKDKGDNQEPMIDVTSPLGNQQINGGQTVSVNATITDNDELHEVHLTVINTTTQAEVVHFHNHVDVQTYNLNETFVAAAGVTYEIKVEADDHSGNHAEVEFTIHAN
ncbi:MAG TPA: DUF4625 domain-containing protein, partial [Chitinophagaceae bacterium]|nr:DUF4625 domain-containing protein [Chitinophagaceae bacterium]